MGIMVTNVLRHVDIVYTRKDAINLTEPAIMDVKNSSQIHNVSVGMVRITTRLFKTIFQHYYF